MSSQRHFILLIAVVVLFASHIASGQPANPTTSPPPEMKVKAVDVPPGCKQPVDQSGNNEQGTQGVDKLCKAGIGDKLIVDIENLSKDTNAGDLVLFLEGRPLNGVNAVRMDHRLAFDLKRTDGSSQAWSALLAKPDLHPYRSVKVGVGFAGKEAFEFSDPKHPPKIALRIYYPFWAVLSFIGLVLTLVLFVYLAKTTGVIRDLSPPQLTATSRPYSLARTQAAFWFFLVIGSFIFLYLITGDYNTITEQALILMGIGTGTALGAAMIDATKNDTANNQLSELNPQQAQLQAEVIELQGKVDAGTATPEDKVQLDAKNAQLKEVAKKIADASSGLSKPTTDGFRRDLLTDVNGINFHRFQMLVWTIVLGFLFCAGVYSNLVMPQFSNTLLALMGISSGTYLGFKIPERQT